MSVHLYDFGDRIDAYTSAEAARADGAPLALAMRAGMGWSVRCGDRIEALPRKDAARQRLRDLAEVEAARRHAAEQARMDLHPGGGS